MKILRKSTKTRHFFSRNDSVPERLPPYRTTDRFGFLFEKRDLGYATRARLPATFRGTGRRPRHHDNPLNKYSLCGSRTRTPYSCGARASQTPIAVVAVAVAVAADVARKRGRRTASRCVAYVHFDAALPLRAVYPNRQRGDRPLRSRSSSSAAPARTSFYYPPPQRVPRHRRPPPLARPLTVPYSVLFFLLFSFRFRRVVLSNTSEARDVSPRSGYVRLLSTDASSAPPERDSRGETASTAPRPSRKPFITTATRASLCDDDFPAVSRVARPLLFVSRTRFVIYRRDL